MKAEVGDRRAAPVLWLIVPCYNEESVLPLTMPRLARLLDDLTAAGLVSCESRIVYVDDGSTDGTWDIVCQAHEADTRHCCLHLGHNAGQQNAMLAGMEMSVGQAGCVVTIDADLQDDVQVIPEMVRHYLEGYEIVYGVRCDRRSDTFFKRNTALAFYRLMNWLGAKTVYNHSEFRLLGSIAVEQLMTYRERDLFLRAIVPQLGYRSTTVAYERHRRAAGETKYSAWRLIAHALRGITSASVRPIRLVSLFGLVFIAIAIVVAGWALYNLYMGRSVAGWVSLILSIWFVGGCMLVALGLIGEYIGNIAENVKRRPRYNITDQRL